MRLEARFFWDRVLDIIFLILNTRTNEEWLSDLRTEAHRETASGPLLRVFRDVAVDEAVHHLGTNRNAIYKMKKATLAMIRLTAPKMALFLSLFLDQKCIVSL